MYVVNSVSPSGKWQTLQQQMCDALNRRKDALTLSILDRSYRDVDVLFVQVRIPLPCRCLYPSPCRCLYPSVDVDVLFVQVRIPLPM